MTLSGNRAKAVMDYLVNKSGGQFRTAKSIRGKLNVSRNLLLAKELHGIKHGAAKSLHSALSCMPQAINIPHTLVTIAMHRRIAYRIS